MEKLKIIFGYVLICIIWGSTWLGIKYSVEAFPPLFATAGRFISAAIFIFLILQFGRIPLKLDRNSMKIYLTMSILSFTIPFSLVYWAETFISSGLGAILFATFPFFVILFSFIEFKEPVGIFKVIGVTMGFIGIVIIFSEDIGNGNNSIFGILAILGSATLQAYMTIYIKSRAGYLNPIAMNFIPLLISGILLLGISSLFESVTLNNFTTRGTLAVIYMGVFGTVITFSTYYWLMKKIDVVLLAISTFITPILALFLGYLFLSETFSSNIYFASSLVLIGILFANFRGLKNYFLKKRLNAEHN